MDDDTDCIRIRGACENNLKNVSLDIPKNRLVVFAGVSGSGKSSLAFGTIAVEAARQWQNNYSLYLRNKMPHYERPKVESIGGLAPCVVVDQRSPGASSRSTVGTAVDAAPLLRLLFSRCGTPSAGGSMAYSFNHPLGMCPDCTGLGESLVLREETMFDPERTLRGGAILFSQFSAGWQAHLWQNNPLLDPDKKLRDFTDAEWRILREGSPEPVKVGIKSNNTGRVDLVPYEGVVPRFCRLYLRRDITKLRQSLQDEILSHVRKGPCATCGGTGLNPRALASKIDGRNIVDLMDMTVAELAGVLARVDDPRGASLARQIRDCVSRMADVGIGYLSLSRRTDTLSGGELQRVKMVRNLGSALSNVTYVFDEPTAGLHPADADRIGRLLLDLRARRNNVLVVEHSRQMIELADHVVEMGPRAGTEGGRVVYQGGLAGLRAAGTPTARALRETVEVNPAPLPWTEGFEIRDACDHNLKHVSVTVPKGVLVAVCGVAGSGKSSLAVHALPRACPDAVVVDQKPIGASIRSTPATYTGAMDEIRRLFAEANGVDPAWFSFNSKGGCPVCKGTGQISYDMAFAEPVVVPCEECGGHRYNPRALSYRCKGLDIEDALRLTVREAADVFDDAKLRALLKGLADVGLDYLSLGQPTSTLSGGEVQRIKLASELGRSGRLYVLDEPSTGLHPSDVARLLALLRRLVADGNTVVVVEHKLSLIAAADWVIDLGPEGGAAGGEILYAGPPAGLVDCPRSKTAAWLRAATAHAEV